MAALSDEELKRNNITELPNGEFYCHLCWKQPSDMGRVREHLGSHDHTRRMSIKAYCENPLAWVPVEQHRWTVIQNCAATCRLCHKAMVETHWNCAGHLNKVQWEMSQQQQQPWAPSSSQSYISSATTQSSSPLPHVNSCQHEMTSQRLEHSPPPLPPVPLPPRQRCSGRGFAPGPTVDDSAAYSPVLEHTPCDVRQSSAALPETGGQQHELVIGDTGVLLQAAAHWQCPKPPPPREQRSSGSCIATGVTVTAIAACRPAADQTLDKEERLIYYV